MHGTLAQTLKTFLLLVLLTAVVVAIRQLPILEPLEAFILWAQDSVWGPPAFVGMYVIATVTLVPGTVLTLVAGYSFGLVLGTITVSVGSVLGSLAAFLIGRTWARDLVAQKADGYRAFKAIDRAITSRGFTVVLLMRLSPIFPYNVLNYLFGITQVRTRDYVVASLLGMLPATVLYVYLGTAAKTLSDLATEETDPSQAQTLLLAIGLIATAAVTILVARLSRKAMQEMLGEEA